MAREKKKEPKKIARIGRGGIPILENGLTIYQDRFIETALETGFKSISKIAKMAKVPLRNYYSWMKTSVVFQKAWKDLWGRQIDKALPAVVDALIKRVQKTGDPVAARLLLELTGLSKQHIKIEQLSDEELNARILQLSKEAGVGGASGGSGTTEKGPDEGSPEADVRKPGSLD